MVVQVEILMKRLEGQSVEISADWRKNKKTELVNRKEDGKIKTFLCGPTSA